MKTIRASKRSVTVQLYGMPFLIHLEQPAQPEGRGLLVERVHKEAKAPKAFRVRKGFKGQPAQLGHRGHKAPKAFRVRREYKVPLVLQGRQARPVAKVLRGLKAPKAYKGLLE